MPLVEQELLTLLKHMSSPQVVGGVRVTTSLVLCVCFFRSLFVFLYFILLALVLSVFLQFTDSDYPFGTFKHYIYVCNTAGVL